MKAHPIDGVSLTFAILFFAVVALWLLGGIGLALPSVGWWVAGALILLGLAGLIGALRRNHRNGAAHGDTTGEPWGTHQ